MDTAVRPANPQKIAIESSQGAEWAGTKLRPELDIAIRKEWSDILKYWHDCLDRYIDYCLGVDLPYWHNELSNVGLLATACYQAGYVSLQEYAEDKTGRRNVGRGDLWVGTEVNEYALEAKFVSARFGQDMNNSIETLIHHRTCGLESALSDSKAKLNTEGLIRLGGIFVCPRISETHQQKIQWDQFISQVEETASPDILAWHFPRSDSLPSARSKGAYSDLFPGVIFLAKRLKEY